MDRQWIFIWATGRSGSTTILDMLNSVPCVSLSGENGDFIREMMQLDRTTRNLNGRKGAWLTDIDDAMLVSAQKSWIGALTRRHANYSGFKEIRTESIPFIKNLFPQAFHIFNYRKNHSLQLQSEFQRSSSDSDLIFQETSIRKLLRTERVIEFPLEEFSVERFNFLLRWIGIRRYRFARVLHSNDGGYGSDERATCTTSCEC